MEVEKLQRRIAGRVTASGDPGYEGLRRGLVWNQLKPARHPELIVQVATEHDVIEAVRFARAHRMKVAVRGGGHSWVGFPLRDGGMLVDLGQLDQLSLDPDARTASIQPAVTGRELNRRLAPHGLAFPVGHCSSVPLSGYLLNGGLGWNSHAWGPACFSVEGARVVTADGAIAVVDHEQHADLLWALRGGGPGFFGVVTQYLLKVYPAPRAITSSTHYYPLERLQEVGEWAAGIARQLPIQVELALFVAPAPPGAAARAGAGGGFVTVLSAIAFLDSEREAADVLGVLDRCPVHRECVKREVGRQTSFEALLDLGGMLWPERHRYLADTFWSDSPAAELAVVQQHFGAAPSPKSLAVCAFSTGEGIPAFPDAAFSMAARTLLLCYAIWERPEDDAPNAAWHRELTAALTPFAIGHYVGEADIVRDPARAERSFARESWQRLETLRRTYDPDGLFHGHFDGS